MGLTLQRLKEVLHYNPDLGVFVWRKKTSRKVLVGEVASYTRKDGYMSIRLDGDSYLTHRLAWFYMTGAFPEGKIDHKDCNPSNNKWTNLRECSDQGNGANSGIPINNTSGVKGVHWHKVAKKWHVQAKLKGERVYLGLFVDIEDAKNAREEFAKKHHGEFYHPT